MKRRMTVGQLIEALQASQPEVPIAVEYDSHFYPVLGIKMSVVGPYTNDFREGEKVLEIVYEEYR